MGVFQSLWNRVSRNRPQGVVLVTRGGQAIDLNSRLKYMGRGSTAEHLWVVQVTAEEMRRLKAGEYGFTFAPRGSVSLQLVTEWPDDT